MSAAVRCSRLVRWPQLTSVAAVSLLITSCGGAVASSGGLRPTNPFGWSTVQAPGASFTDSMLLLQNKADEPLTITRVTTSTTGDLEFMGALVAGTDRTANIQTTPGWPPTDPAYGTTVAAEGAVLEASEQAAEGGYALLLGFRAGTDERSTRTSVTVEYEQGGSSHRVTYPYTVAVCSTTSRWTINTCPAEYGTS